MKGATAMYATQLSFPRFVKEEAPAYTETSLAAVSATANAIVTHVNVAYQAFASRLTEAHKAKLGKRLERALEIANAGDQVIFTEDLDVFKVRSVSTKGNYFYQVNVASKTCTCPDYDNGNTCKHILAAYFTQKAYELAQVLPDPTWPDPLPQPESQPTIHEIAEQRIPGEHIIYATVMVNDTATMVELLALNEDGTADVRTLPIYSSDGRLIPNFCFPSPFGTTVRYSTLGNVPKSELLNVSIFNH